MNYTGMSPIQFCRYMWLAWILAWMLLALRTKRTQQRLKITEALPYVIPTGVGVYLIFNRPEIMKRMGLWWPWVSTHTWLGLAGVAMTATGLLFAIWARLYLGANWSGQVTVKQEHELIRSGPYRFVRHPIYSGILFALGGTALCRHNVWAILGFALVWLGLWIKSRLEERFMVQTFGAQYESYRRTTGALLPRLL